MLMTGEPRPAIRTLRGRAITCSGKQAASASARSTLGCRKAPIRIRGSGLRYRPSRPASSVS